MRLLIIEDDIDLRDLIKSYLVSESYIVEATSDGERGINLAKESNYDLIILDLSLPRKDGITICKELRSFGCNTPILILSVTSETPSKVLLLDSGADDYMTKPFEFSELLSRIRAILRRPRSIEEAMFFVDDLMLNLNLNKVTRGGREIYLTKKEFNLLSYLMKNKSKVLSRGSLLEHVWSAESDPFSNTVEAHILNLRKKIGRENEKELIHNIPGRGYKIDKFR
jgi:DNA-binding response OmpR family regulator